MKRILLTIVLVMELVIGVVLYFSYAQIVGTEDISEPNQIQEQQPLVAQPIVAQPIQPRTFLQQQNTSQANKAGLSQIQPTEQLTEQPLSLSSTVLSYFEPLPSAAQANNTQRRNELVALGRMLFYDPRLSVNGTISCNTCHLLDKYGVDQLALSLSHSGEPTKRNSPTVYNAALHVDQFWDGRSPTVEEQAKEPILSGAEMGFEHPVEVERTISEIPGYLSYFEEAFPNDLTPITFDNIATAIGAFERELMTPSRFDKFLNGDWNQFTPDEFRGLGTFVEVGCIDCHQGTVVGGQLYKKLGLVEPYPTKDQGRYTISRAESDRYVFKVPTLRNVAETGPYLHDGSIATLPEMVRLMARYQLGKTLDDQQLNDIVSFLQTLTGEIPFDTIAEPLLP